ncbi:MAG: Na/Pi symporter [Planctomycetota bacterium]
MGLAQVSGLLAGLAIFLFGMTLTGEGLREAAGRRLRLALALIGRSRLRALVAGIALTVAVNSSGAVTTMMVTLSGAGLVGAGETFGVLLGAGIGTAITLQILTLNLSPWAAALMIAGLVMATVARREERRHLGRAVLGIGLLFFGLGLMKSSVADLGASEFAKGLLGSRSFALAGSIVFTALTHSSAATILLVQGLAVAGAMPFQAAIFAVIGANVGTCATALLGTLSAGARGRQVALFNLLYKSVTAAAAVPLAGALAAAALRLAGSGGPAPAGSELAHPIAFAHLVFNVAGAVLFLPFLAVIARAFARREKRAERACGITHEAPSPAEIEADPDAELPRVLPVLLRMGERTSVALEKLLAALEADTTEPIRALEEEAEVAASIDEVLTTILSEVDSGKLSPEADHVRDAFLAALAHFARIASLAAREGGRLARRKLREDIQFSMESSAEMREFHRFVAEDLAAARSILAGEQAGKIDAVLAADREAAEKERRLLAAHRERLRRGVVDEARSALLYRDLVIILRGIHAEVARLVERLERDSSARR